MLSVHLPSAPLPSPARRHVPLGQLHPKQTPAAPGRLKALVGDWLYALVYGRPGEWAEWSLPALVAILGAFQAFGSIKGPPWLGAVVSLLVLERVLVRLRKGSALARLLAQVSRINTSFAGNLDDVLARLLADKRARLPEAQAHALCKGLLHRIRHFGELALDAPELRPLRATLAIPVLDEQRVARAVRVWCYDEPYAERRWTELPLGLEGAPAAFETGAVQVIADLLRVPGVENPAARPYRSIVSIPVFAGGPSGSCLAVVSLDAAEQGFFRQDVVVQKLIPMVRPALSSIALVIALKRPGEPHVFGQ